MDVLTSSEFRRRYAGLLRPTVVTANGHAIGEWHPLTPVARGVVGDDGLTPGEPPEPDSRVEGMEGYIIVDRQSVTHRATQAERDAILRKINRAK
jgi:hypothetical protein